MKHTTISTQGKSRMLVLGMLATELLLMSAGADAVLNRKVAVGLVKEIEAEYTTGQVNVHINELEGEVDPGVKVGDSLRYVIRSRLKRHLLLVLVDPKGMVNVVFPDYSIRETPDTYVNFSYPPEGTGDFYQGEPVGIETIIVFASEKAITQVDLNLSLESDIQTIGNDEGQILQFVKRMNKLLAGSPTHAMVYQYYVDSDSEVQFETRAIRRELKKRVQQIDVLSEQENRISEIAGIDNRTTGTDSITEVSVQSDALAVNDIRFERNSDALTSIGRIQLDLFGSEFLNVLEENPAISVTLEGHTDDTGDLAYNQRLSERRAISAKHYLVQEFGLSNSNILTRGMGEARPLVANSNAASRALNRRVEIRVGLGAD